MCHFDPAKKSGIPCYTYLAALWLLRLLLTSVLDDVRQDCLSKMTHLLRVSLSPSVVLDSLGPSQVQHRHAIRPPEKYGQN